MASVGGVFGALGGRLPFWVCDVVWAYVGGVFGALGGRLPFPVCDVIWAYVGGVFGALRGRFPFTASDDEGVGKKADRTASRTPMSAMRFYACRR